MGMLAKCSIFVSWDCTNFVGFLTNSFCSCCSQTAELMIWNPCSLRKDSFWDETRERINEDGGSAFQNKLFCKLISHQWCSAWGILPVSVFMWVNWKEIGEKYWSSQSKGKSLWRNSIFQCDWPNELFYSREYFSGHYWCNVLLQR